MSTMTDPLVELARRLRLLRAEHWAGVQVTQPQLSAVLGVSNASISSWENENNAKVPPAHRLRDYALFFATRRSLEQGRRSLVPRDELTAAENVSRAELEDDLLVLRDAALARVAEVPTSARPAWSAPAEEGIGGGLLSYPDGRPITIVCAPFPQETLDKIAEYTDIRAPDYAVRYKYADIDALFELHGHMRAANPYSDVRIKLAPDAGTDDMATHLVLLGGVDWNSLTRDVSEAVAMKVVQDRREDDDETVGFKVVDDESVTFSPQLRRRPAVPPELVKDVAHFYRGPNPFNLDRTVTIFNGMYGRGTYGVVRALTDDNFRRRNTDYLESLLETNVSVSILTWVQIINGAVLTPDLTRTTTRLYQFCEEGS